MNKRVSSQENGMPWLIEPTRALQGSQSLKGSGQSSKGDNNMVTQSVTHVNPYKVEVLSITPVNAGNIKARASVRVSVMLLAGGNTYVNEYQDLHGVKVVQQEGQRAWVAMPDAPWEGRHFQLFQPQPGGYQKEAITGAVLAAWDALKKGGR